MLSVNNDKIITSTMIFIKVKDNLIVKNIIVNKDKSKNQITPFVATEKWIGQLCNRLQVHS